MKFLRISVLALACGAAAYALPPAYAAGDHDEKAQSEHVRSDEKSDDKGAEFRARRAEHLAERLKLTDAQKAAFKEYQDVQAKAWEDRRSAFRSVKLDELSLEKRLEFLQTQAQAHLDAIKAEGPKLLAFYNSLDDHQKGQFDEISRHHGEHEGGKGWGGGEHDRGHHEDD
jgi:Spy/CpxP family protein refolding chaperone